MPDEPTKRRKHEANRPERFVDAETAKLRGAYLKERQWELSTFARLEAEQMGWPLARTLARWRY